jgi:hypothetical protein
VCLFRDSSNNKKQRATGEEIMASRNLKRLDLYCAEYKTVAAIKIVEDHPNGQPHLTADYEDGGYNGEKHFAAAIPEDWTDEDLLELIFLSWPRRAGRYWPTWELCTRDYASETLFRYWKNERPPH